MAETPKVRFSCVTNLNSAGPELFILTKFECTYLVFSGIESFGGRVKVDFIKVDYVDTD
jgi:hypothetical protein